MDHFLTKRKFRRPVSLETVKTDWRTRGYSCQRFRDPPGRVWRDFAHATNEVVTVVQGRLEIVIDGRSLTADEGDEVFIPSNAVHTVKNASQGEAVWLFGYG